MSDQPNSQDPTRRSARALPSPPPDPAPSERQASQAGAGASSFNASLLEAIRESSRLTQESFRGLTAEVRGIHKDLSAHIKSLQAEVKYHQLKQSKYAKFEEEFFREGTKLIARSKGLLDKFPSDSPIYRSDFGAAVTPSSGKARDENGRFTSSGKQDAVKPEGSILAGTSEDWKSLKEFADLWKTRFKAFSDYSQTPIKLTDTIPAYIMGAISKSIAERKAAEAKAANDAKKREDAAVAQQKAAEEEAAKAAEDSARWDELLDKYFARLKDTLDAKWPDEERAAGPAEEASPAPIVDAQIETLRIGSFILDSFLLPSGSAQAALPAGGASPFALPAPNDLEGFSWEDLGSTPFVPEKEFARAAEVPTSLVPTSSSEISSYVFGSPPALPGISGPEAALFGRGRPDGPFAQPSSDEAQADFLDDVDDLLSQYFTEQHLFFADPASSPVGKWLTDLVAPAEGPDDAKVKNPKLELPDWLKTWAFGLLAEVGLFLLELLPIALALAAGILLLSVGGLLVLGAIAVAIVAIAAVVAFLGFVLGVSLLRTLGIANDLLEGMVDAFLGFLDDPGAFAEKLLSGLGEGLKDLLTGISEGVGKAFQNIPILNTIAKTFDAVAADTRVISGAVTGVIKETLQGVKTAVGALSGLTLALLSLVGGSVLGAVIDVKATISGVFAWIKAIKEGNFRGAGDAYATAFSQSVGADVAMIREVGNIVSSPEAKGTINTLANNITNHHDAKTQAAIDEASRANEARNRAQGYSSQTNTANIQHVSAFSTIPVLGAF